MSDKTEINLERIRAYDAGWNESQHPRAKNGRFSSGHGARSSLPANKRDARTHPAKKSLNLASGDGKIYQSVNDALHKAGLLNPSEKVLKPEPIKIIDVGSHGIETFMKRADLTIEDAQEYVDNALVMVQQSKDKFCYIAEDGTAIVLDNGRLVSVYSKKYYDPRMKRKVGLILECLNLTKK